MLIAQRVGPDRTLITMEKLQGIVQAQYLYSRKAMALHNFIYYVYYILKININLTFGRSVALGSTQALTEMSTRNIPWGVKAAGA